MLIVRRVHLYAGLVLVPLVLLYGVTAFLFNHPGAFSPTHVEHVSAADARAGGLEGSLDPDAIARAVVTELARDQEFKDRPLDFKNARQTRGASLEVRTEETTGRVSIGEGGAVRISWRPRRERSKPSPYDRRRFSVAEEDLDELRDEVDGFVRERGREPESVRVRSYSIAFDLEHGDEVWAARYDVARGTLTCRRPEEETSPSLRRTLLRLHVAHGFPADGGARTFWAVLVDIMATAMVVWGLSGIAMWWQIRRTRFWGAVSLLIGCAVIGAAAFAMLPS